MTWTWMGTATGGLSTGRLDAALGRSIDAQTAVLSSTLSGHGPYEAYDRAHPHAVLVAHYGTALIGYLDLRFSLGSGSVHVAWISRDETLGKIRFAASGLAIVEAEARARQFKWLDLSASAHEASLIKYYESLGFTTRGKVSHGELPLWKPLG